LEKRVKAIITGIVQGVGFRPFVYHLATSRQIKGFVKNTSEGVVLEVQGEDTDIDGFFQDITRYKPPLARITSIKREEIPLNHTESFTIIESDKALQNSALISPDIATCEDCLRELFDPKDRRYLYPFINCTNCGPRYTIIKDLPYDRPNTSMAHFPMCPACKAEYEDPLNRRFHAQPIACWECGPKIWIVDQDMNPLDTKDPIATIHQVLKEGYIVAIKGLGGFHLAVDAQNTGAIKRLRERKHREEKPFAIMVRDLNALREIALLNRRERALLLSNERPIVILRKRKSHPLSEEVAPNNQYFGVMLPYTPLHHLIMRGPFYALVMTSGNLSEEPICGDNEEAYQRLKGIADFWALHNRDILQRADDSVFKVVGGSARPIRRSRGYAPMPVFLLEQWKDLPPALGVGAELKNTFCLLRGNQAFLSQHIGDMENLETLDFFLETLQNLKHLLSMDPVVVGHDLHPDYLTTKYAQELKEVEIFGIQHHHAHIVSCMAENGEEGPVIGVSLDGTGLGGDGTIWGGELLLCSLVDYKRQGHLETVPMLGGDTGARYPWKMALSLLFRSYGEEARDLAYLLLKDIPTQHIDLAINALKAGFNTFETSSTGRLFDGISALLGLRMKNTFEGQAAMELENLQARERIQPYEATVEWSDGSLILRTSPIVQGIVADLLANKKKGSIARRFHASLIQLLTLGVDTLRRETGIQKVALSGGCFQNATLLSGLKRNLKRMGLYVLTHRILPTNDAGISLGQAVAAAMLKGGMDGLLKFS